MNKYDSFALIDDVSTGAAAGYELVAVDGSTVKRREHTAMVTVVPFAILEPGYRNLSLVKCKTLIKVEGPEFLSISAKVEAGKLYRLKRQEGRIVLVEDHSTK